MRWPWPCVLLLLLPGSAAAQDTVIVVDEAGRQKTLTGRILDYSGSGLRLQTQVGPERHIEADKVLQVTTQYGRMQTEADRLFAKGDFDPALNLYRQAMENETRRWVRHRIVARGVWCYRALDRPSLAGEAFLVLIRDDLRTPYFDCIPLAWTSRMRPPVALETAARQWLGRPEPAAQLLGASHLLTTADELTATRRLRDLSTQTDPRVAQLAQAQLWRTAVVTVTAGQIDTWGKAIEQMLEPLAAGPYFVLGDAHQRLGQWEQAALSRLRVPILYPQHRGLAAQSLLEAGRALEKLDRTQEALRLYQELIAGYPETSPVAEAQGRIEQIGQTKI